nr:MAG TPA: Baseplate J like protein [Caudoviricetes sp.]
MAYEWEYLDSSQYTFDGLMQQCLARIPDDFDKRQGSVIYDAIAPCIVEIAKNYQQLQLFYMNTYLMTASGNSLDYRCYDYGIDRLQPTYAQRLAKCLDKDAQPTDIEIGTRYSTISDISPIYYKCTEKLDTGSFVLECETEGTVGNEYVGELLPIEYNKNLGSIVISTIYKPARDLETDDELRERTLEWLRNKPFGGNVQDYVNWCTEYDGIGQVQVYPTWNGGGTVKLSIIDPSNNTCSPEFIEQVKEYFDPEPYATGLGQAPIGHNVTVVTATEKEINISADVMLDETYEQGQIKEPCKQAIQGYIDELRSEWGERDRLNKYSLTVAIFKIIVALNTVSGIINVTNVTINGESTDLELTEDKLKQELPKLGEVTINAT